MGRGVAHEPKRKTGLLYYKTKFCLRKVIVLPGGEERRVSLSQQAGGLTAGCEMEKRKIV